jgi:hypothetical protein
VELFSGCGGRVLVDCTALGKGWEGEDGDCVHVVLEHVSCGTSCEVVGGDLDHDLVEVLDDIFELACGMSGAGCLDMGIGRLTLDDLLVCLPYGRHCYGRSAERYRGYEVVTFGRRWRMFLQLLNKVGAIDKVCGRWR